ncbi:DUF533 domain-containing protein [Falsiroseomonas sp. HC035]|uniref:DUF533 domain-containing protein n=1 Tax=Falsiroseomonas sp. HC035 TaxID=3390999 RepID=UPI003D31FC83
MTTAQQFIGRLMGFGRNRDGQFHALQEDALAEAAPPEPPTRRHRHGPEPQRIVQEALAAKVLGAWLQNRHQTLFPLTLNLGTLDAGGRALVVRMMVAAADADGGIDEAERDRIGAALDAIGAGEAERRLLPEAMAAPLPLGALLNHVMEARLGPHAYAASLLALDRRSRVNQAWLDYLAARLALPEEVTASLNRRYRA